MIPPRPGWRRCGPVVHRLPTSLQHRGDMFNPPVALSARASAKILGPRDGLAASKRGAVPDRGADGYLRGIRLKRSHRTTGTQRCPTQL